MAVRNDGTMIKKYIQEGLHNSAVEYENVLTDNKGFVIRRIADEGNSLFVFNPEEMQVYIKNETNGKICSRDKLKKSAVIKFFSDWSSDKNEIRNDVIDISTHFFMTDCLPVIVKNNFLMEMLINGFTAFDMLLMMNKSDINVFTDTCYKDINLEDALICHRFITPASVCAGILYRIFGNSTSEDQDAAWKIKDKLMDITIRCPRFMVAVTTRLKRYKVDFLKYLFTNYINMIDYIFSKQDLEMKTNYEFFKKDKEMFDIYFKKYLEYNIAKDCMIYDPKGLEVDPEKTCKEYYVKQEMPIDWNKTSDLSLYESDDGRFKKKTLTDYYGRNVLTFDDKTVVDNTNYYQSCFLGGIRPNAKLIGYIGDFYKKNYKKSTYYASCYRT